ncbi:MAG: hypothetical protein ABJH20_13650 [Rhizobiaceae bacterium]
MSETDWNRIRQDRLSDHRPDGWPEGVNGISLNGLSLLGIHERTGKLYWDGKEIVTKRIVRLRGWEVVLAIVATVSAAGMFALDLARTLNWWGLGAFASG